MIRAYIWWFDLIRTLKSNQIKSFDTLGENHVIYSSIRIGDFGKDVNYKRTYLGNETNYSICNLYQTKGGGRSIDTKNLVKISRIVFWKSWSTVTRSYGDVHRQVEGETDFEAELG